MPTGHYLRPQLCPHTSGPKRFCTQCVREYHRKSRQRLRDARGPRQTEEQRFWSKVSLQSSPEVCWEWRGLCNYFGYGLFNVGKQCIRAHRYAYALQHGPIPFGLLVLHHCDNPPCVNYSHLFLGNHADNSHDAQAKGRLAQGDNHRTRKNRYWEGEKNPSAILKESQVIEILQLIKAGVSSKEIQKVFSLSPAHVCNIKHRRIWKNIVIL